MMCAVLCVWIICVGVRLIYLQTAGHEFLVARARGQQQGSRATRAGRGLILDRNGRELARSVEVASVFAVPDEIENVEKDIARLADLLNEDAVPLIRRVNQARKDKRKFVWLSRKLDAPVAKKIQTLKIKGVYTRPESKRFYPNNSLAAHIIGFVGLDEHGLGGIEQTQENRLRGESGRVYLNLDVSRKAYDAVEVAARDGGSIVLTLDAVVQYQTEKVLEAAVAQSRARAGTAVVLDPRTGEILALANAPTFDPNTPPSSTSKANRQSDTADSDTDDVVEMSPADAARVRVNHALQNIYEPGSTFKIVAYAGAMEEGLAKPDDTIDCQMGGITIAGRRIRDHHAYGTLTLTEALAKSSNVAAIKLGLRLGDERLHSYITRFGFGACTGIDLPGETAGLLRPVKKWQASSVGSIAIGQEIGVTPLQIASAFGTIANDGVRVAPHIVRGVRASDGALIANSPAAAMRVTSEKTARALRGMLESVTLRGTAKKAQLEGYTAAGKTGTAQKIDPATRAYSATKHVASFAGFAPVENPQVVIVVVLDEPVGAYHGGDAAAPVFRDIADVVLPYLRVMPDGEFRDANDAVVSGQWSVVSGQEESNGKHESSSETSAEAASAMWTNDAEREALNAVREEVTARRTRVIYANAGARALMMPDVRGMSVRDAWRVCARLGLELEAKGEGRAIKQSPEAGESIDAGDKVRLVFSDD